MTKDDKIKNKKAEVPEKVNLAGRPALYDNVEELKVSIEEYFNRSGVSSTITGLAFALGFESRQSFYDYAEKGEFSYIIKRAKLFIESCYESKLSANNPTGPIFFLKNMGWKDKTETDLRTPDGVIINFNKAGRDYETKE